jgi:heme/copper-type cytochrome/quinol oxidase subunit 1
VNPAIDADLVGKPTERQHSALYAWLSTTDHLAIGRRFIVTAFAFFVLGGILALIMRLQLATPLAHLVGPDRYNQIFTTHGTRVLDLRARRSLPVCRALV